MKKTFAATILLTILFVISTAASSSALIITSGIWNESTSEFTETSYFNAEDVSAENNTRLRFTFNIEEPVYSDTLYIDLFATFDGTEYQFRNMMDASAFIETDNLSGNLFANHDFSAYGDTSLLSEVHVIGYYGEESASATMVQGTSPQTAPVPEPATMLLLGTGLVGIAGLKRKNPIIHP
jgi:hypothetical protein